MHQLTQAHLPPLKEALLSLRPTGAAGFEGLLAAVLSEVCGQPFRLASSGSQRGRDGNSAFDAGATYFEAKLYHGTVDSSVVGNKITELSIDDAGQVDTWALCATSQVSTQVEDLCRKGLAKIGIGCLVLDWPDHVLPPLAVLLALAPSTTEAFITTNSREKTKVVGLKAHLDGVAADSQFATQSSGLRTMLTEPTLALGLAKAANRSALIGTFSDRLEARRVFGQPLAPLDSSGPKAIERPQLSSRLAPAFAGPPGAEVFLVIGDEGTGKSWLVAGAWARASPAPLLVAFTADELRPPMAFHDIEGVLISKLASQSDGDTPEARVRWKRRFAGWRVNAQPADPRLIVFVDGLNQAPDFDWARWIDGAAKTLADLGGYLVVTTTQRHFASRLRNSATAAVRRVIVTDWSEDELARMLNERGIAADGLSADVTRFLRNPRLLGIALELLDGRDIERLDELTVGRLLFEHIRSSERTGAIDVPVDDFVRELRAHADELVRRQAEQQYDDLKLFSTLDLDKRLRAVAESRFFEAVKGEPDLYAIKDEGLPLALGLSIVANLRKEERNGQNPGTKLAIILEPVLALAETSAVILSALEVACLDSCSTTVSGALIQHFLSLQNLAEKRFPAFAALVKTAPEAFLVAGRAMALSEDHQPHARWLTTAVLEARSHPDVAAAIHEQVPAWLSTYSLAPERRMISTRRREEKAESEAELTKRRNELEARLSQLSRHERDFMNSRLVRQDDGNLSGLHRLALQLAAGSKLAGLGDALVNCAFANALNSGLDAPHAQFAQLVCLNFADWRDTRAALLKSGAPLMQDGTSTTGQWALVEVLRATGDQEDASRAEELVEELTRDRPSFLGGRLVEKYCETDPCDPTAVRPSNIDETSAKYAMLNPSRLWVGMQHTTEDHFFREARAGLARFEPQPVIAAIRRFARDVEGREGFARRQGVLGLLPHAAVLESGTVHGLVDVARGSVGATSGSEDEQDAWITGQYALFAALPHKSGNEQLDAIAEYPGRTLLLSLLHGLSPADEPTIEAHLECVVQGTDPDAQARVIGFVLYTGSPLTPRAQKLVEPLLGSPDKLVRSLAMGVAAKQRHADLLAKVAASGWDAGTLECRKDHYEIWWGSEALVAAAEVGVAEASDVVARIAPRFLAGTAGFPNAAGKYARAKINAAFLKAAALGPVADLPLVEQPVPAKGQVGPPLMSIINEPSSMSEDTFFERMNESREAFAARQKRARDAIDRFATEVTLAEAGIILDDFEWSGFEAIVAADRMLVKSWMGQMAGMDGPRLRSLHFFGLGLARATAKSDPVSAATLFRRLAAEAPLIRRVVGTARIPAEALAVWSNAELVEIKLVCFERLDRAANDAEISNEVMAALMCGKAAVVGEYIDLRIASGLPSMLARVLTVAGYCDSSAHATQLLQTYASREGFVGRAVAAARYAYERNDWSRHWYEKMQTAATPEEFWRYAVLFTKIIDARYDLWCGDRQSGSSIFTAFLPTVKERITARIESWQTKRKNKLFGQDVPDPVFLA